jgi:hypothetical protein
MTRSLGTALKLLKLICVMVMNEASVEDTTTSAALRQSKKRERVSDSLVFFHGHPKKRTIFRLQMSWVIDLTTPAPP